MHRSPFFSAEELASLVISDMAAYSATPLTPGEMVARMSVEDAEMILGVAEALRRYFARKNRISVG